MTGRYHRDPCVGHVAQWLTWQGRQLTPDRPAAEAFLQRLDPSAGCFSFRTFSDTPYTRLAGRDPLEGELHGSLDACWDDLVVLNRLGAAIAVTVNETNCRGRAVSDITRVRALFLDMDRESSPDGFPLLPHIRVFTSPQHCHYYWFLDGLALSGYLAVQRQLAQCYKGDDRACALNQAMQLPGFWRRKRPTSPFITHRTILTDRKNYSLEGIRPLVCQSITG